MKPHAPPRVFYDDAYRSDNYFRHKQWLYKPYISALIALVGLPKGSEVLDAGCGQGFFANAFAVEDMMVYATDLSLVGLRAAKHKYGDAISVFVSDLSRPATTRQFDCVFIRSCTLYNTNLQDVATVTADLLSLVRPGGLLIFAYNTNLSGTSRGWRHHSFRDVRLFVNRCLPLAEFYFINRVDALVLGRYAFNKFVTRANQFICERTSLGGEVVVVSRKAKQIPVKSPSI